MMAHRRAPQEPAVGIPDAKLLAWLTDGARAVRCVACRQGVKILARWLKGDQCTVYFTCTSDHCGELLHRIEFSNPIPVSERLETRAA